MPLPVVYLQSCSPHQEFPRDRSVMFVKMRYVPSEVDEFFEVCLWYFSSRLSVDFLPNSIAHRYDINLVHRLLLHRLAALALYGWICG